MGNLSFTVGESNESSDFGEQDSPLDLLAEPIATEDAVETEAVEAVVRAVIEPEIEIDLREHFSNDFMSTLHGRLAVVTGANDGVGSAVALALVDAGARVCVLGRDADLLRSIVETASTGTSVLSLQCDLGSTAEVRSAADFVNRFDRSIDVLVHCANVRVPGSIGRSEVADLDEQYLVNLRGPFLLTQALLEGIGRGPGHVVFVDPSDGDSFTSVDTQYAMSRSGIAALAQGLRDETADLGVRVTTVHVGGRLDDGRNNSLSPEDVADVVLGAIEMPTRIEITDLHVRARMPSSLVA